MRLLHTETLRLEEFHDDRIPSYAILSHTWDTEETTFQQWSSRNWDVKPKGVKKVEEACQLAKRDGYCYIWVDTACIDKSSSSELTEAINSMFAWYAQSEVCYAYLADIPTFKPLSYREGLCRSRWFRRGWTLQELLAPQNVIFYAADWSRMGTKATLARSIAAASGIEVKHLFWPQSDDQETSPHHALIHETPVGEKMSWVARRETTRIEDIAYCMLGLFGIYMPLVYGEGTRAFIRLQEEIVKVSDDHSIFCWSWGTGNPNGSLFSPRPQSFLDAACYSPRQAEHPLPYSLTNSGLSITMPLIQCWSSWIGALSVETNGEGELAQVGLPMSRHLSTSRFVRHDYPDGPIVLCDYAKFHEAQIGHLFAPAGIATKWGRPQPLPSLTTQAHCQAGVLLSFSPRSVFAGIKTMPPGRFSERDSILTICPSQVSGDYVDPVLQILEIDSEAFGGATLVEFMLANGESTIVLFLLRSVIVGSYYQPQWSHFHLPPFFQRYMETQASPGTDNAVMNRDEINFIKSLTHNDLNGSVDQSLGDASNLSVTIANRSFSTNAASVLRHVHIDIDV